MSAVREAVILAAGFSSRFRRKVDIHKLVVPVRDRPLITFPILSLYVAGIRSYVLVTNEEIAPILREKLAPLFEVLEADWRMVINKHPERGNGFSLLVGLQAVTEDKFIVSMGDHIYPPSVARIVSSARPPALGGDSDPIYIDIWEATLIHCSRGRVVRVGKLIGEFEYIDIGVHLFQRDLPYSRCSAIRGELTLSKLINCMARRARFGVADIKGRPWTEIDTYEDYLEVVSGSKRFIVDNVLKEWREFGDWLLGVGVEGESVFRKNVNNVGYDEG